MITADLDRAVSAVFADAGCSGWLHARSLAPNGPEYAWRADDPVGLASVYKVALLVSLCRLADDGGVDLGEVVTTDPAAAAPGPTGVSILPDPVTTTLRNLAVSMMTVSDNAAADIILERVSPERFTADLAALGVPGIVLVDGVRDHFRRLQSATGTSTTQEALAVLADPDRDVSDGVYDVAYSAAASPRDCTRLLARVWDDTAASPAACRFIRDTMRHQVVRSRLASGFPAPLQVAGKTGSIGVIRNEIGVIEAPDEYPVAVAVFTMSARTSADLPVVDRAIGVVARTVVTELRRPR